ncbi:unnamed protein product [Victoria cruziana]
MALGLMQQEKDSLAAKLEEKRFYYMTIVKQMKDALETLLVEEKTLIPHNQRRGVHDTVSGTFKEYELNKKLEDLQRRENDFPPTLKALETGDLEEEIKALTCDKAGEMEYLQSLHDRIRQLKGISEMVKCQCGEEYMVEMPQK